jgi:hypothetical protein
LNITIIGPFCKGKCGERLPADFFGGYSVAISFRYLSIYEAEISASWETVRPPQLVWYELYWW